MEDIGTSWYAACTIFGYESGTVMKLRNSRQDVYEVKVIVLIVHVLLFIELGAGSDGIRSAV